VAVQAGLIVLDPRMVLRRIVVTFCVHGPVSPILANLFLHYTFDCWMRRHHADIEFERYADDVICHCSSEAQARGLHEALEQRFAECKLELHLQKTKIAYCKDANRGGSYPVQQFDFLGYTFRPRRSMNRKGRLFVSFAPAVSNQAAKAMRAAMRSWRLHHRGDLALEDLVSWTRSKIQGWVQYYGRFYPSALQRALHTLDAFLVRWAQRKYKHLKQHKSRAWDWLTGLKSRQPTLFPHWTIGATVGR
jgi:RNA-directed DNA polymerase